LYQNYYKTFYIAGKSNVIIFLVHQTGKKNMADAQICEVEALMT